MRVYRSRVSRVLLGVTVSLLLSSWSLASAASISGGVSGIIKDSRGTPLGGIAVILLEGQFNSKVVKTAITDRMGEFEIKGLIPGLYSVKVSSANYSPLIQSGIAIVADKIASLNLTLENLYLQSILGTQREQRPEGEKEDIESVLRAASSTRPILRVFEADSKKEDSASPQSDGETEPSSAGRGVRGSVRVYGSSYGGDTELSSVGSAFTDFAVAKQLNSSTSLVLAGVVSDSGYAEVDSLIRLADLNGFRKSTVRLSMGVLPYLPATYSPVVNRNAGRLSVYNLDLQDEVKLPMHVSFLYGTEIQLTDPSANAPRIRPKLGAHFRPMAKTTVTYVRTSSLPHLQRTVELEEGKSLTMSMPFQHEYGSPLSLGASRIVHSEVSANQEISPNSKVVVAYYADNLSLHEQTRLLAGSGDPASTNRGLRIAYQRRLSPRFDGSFGYTYGGGVRISGANDFIMNQNFHVVTSNLRTRISSSGTYFSTMYRWVSGDTVTLIDPYQENFENASPGVSLMIAQVIPYVGRFIPGKLEAQFDVRNLLARNNLDVYNSPYIRRIEFLQPSRFVRGGLMLKF